MAGEQIVGGPGRAANVYGEKADTNIPPANMGIGENSEVAMNDMTRNKAAYEFDQGSPNQILMALYGYPSAQTGTQKKPKDQSLDDGKP